MVELVDTQDLKSCNHCGCVGSSPTPGTKTALKSFDFEAILFLESVLKVYCITKIRDKLPYPLIRIC